MKKQYICLTCDIIKSTAKDNEQNMDSIPEILSKLNLELKPVVPFNISAGDEFQGLLEYERNPFHFIEYLEYHLFPLRFRTGIGIGHISTKILSSTLMMRGPVFEFARNALKNAHNGKKLYCAVSENKLDSINSILTLLSYIKSQWNHEKIFKRYYFYRKYKSIDKVGEIEGVSRTAINKLINKYGFRDIISVTNKFHKFI